MSQEDLASCSGVTRQSQSKYEKDIRHPDSLYLSAVAKHGVDVQFVLTGKRSAFNLEIREEHQNYKNNPIKTDSNRDVEWSTKSRTERSTSMIEVEQYEIQWLTWIRSIKPGDRQIVEAILKRFALNAEKQNSQDEAAI